MRKWKFDLGLVRNEFPSHKRVKVVENSPRARNDDHCMPFPSLSMSVRAFGSAALARGPPEINVLEGGDPLSPR